MNGAMIPRSHDPQALLIHRDFLQRLAAGLLADPSAAEDAVQETWLAVASEPPEAGSTRSIRAWLATVTRNAARQIGRSERNRRRRQQRSSRPEATPSVQDIAVREELRRDVVAAVLALPATAREAILLRYYEDLPPREIARRLDVPVETVRTRIKRGVARLRDELDAAYGGDRDWRAAMIPMAGLPFVRGVASSTSGLSVAFVAKLVLLLAMIPLLIFGWSRLDAPGDTPPDRNRIAATGIAAAPSDATSPAEPVPVPTDGEPLPVSATSPSSGLEGWIVDERDGSGLGGHPVVLSGIPLESLDDVNAARSADVAEIREAWIERRTVTDTDGGFRFDDLPSGAFLLLLPIHDGYIGMTGAVVLTGMGGLALPVLRPMVEGQAVSAGLVPPPTLAIAASSRDTVTVRRARGALLRGRVIDRDGGGIGDARVAVWPSLLIDARLNDRDLDALFGSFATSVRTDETGAFELSGAVGAIRLVADAAGFHPSGVSLAIEMGDDTVDSSIVLDRELAWIVAGLVRDAGGQPIAGADVHVIDPDADGVWVPDARTDLALYPVDSPHAVTDTAGRFELPVVGTAGSRPYLRVAADGYRTAVGERFEPRAAQRDEYIVELERARPIRFRVVDARDGSPVEPVRVIEQTRSTLVTHDDVRGVTETVNDPSSGPLRLVIEHPEYETGSFDSATDTWDADSVVTLRLEPVPWVIRGAILTGDGTPAPRTFAVPGAVGGRREEPLFQLKVFRHDPTRLLDAGGYPTTPMTGDLVAAGAASHDATSGAFEIPLSSDWTEDEAWVVVELRGAGRIVQSTVRGGDDLLFRVDAAAAVREQCMLAVRAVSGREGIPVGDFFCSVYRDDGRRIYPTVYFAADGSRILPLPDPGRYDLRVRARHFGATWVDGVDVGRGEFVGPLDVTLGRECILQGVVTGTVPGALGGLWVQVFDDRGREVASTSTATEGEPAFAIVGLGPGRYTLRTRHHGFVAEQVVTLDENEVAGVELELRPAVPVTYRFDNLGRLDQPVFVVRDALGRRIYEHAGVRPEYPPTDSLLPGTYEAVLYGPSVGIVVARFSVPRSMEPVEVWIE